MPAKRVIAFRPEPFLVELVKDHARKNGGMSPSGEYCFSKNLHGLFSDLNRRAAESDKNAKNAAILQNYIDRLSKDTKPFHCQALNSDVTFVECYNCQYSAQAKPSQTPKEVLDCPRIRGTV